MKLAFLIYSYFPYGGQQRDFMRIVRECLQRGHEIHVFAFRWEGEIPTGVNLHTVPIKGWSRLARYRNYTDVVGRQLADMGPDCVIGFNKMPHLDIYFAADSCFLEKAETQRGGYYRFTPRFRHFSRYEEAVFGNNSQSLSLLLSDLQRQAYLKHYPHCAERLEMLPPGISADRRVECRDPEVRSELRRELAIDEEELLVLQVGSGFRIKGVDRSLRAVASLPEELRQRVRYVLVGQDRARRFLWQAKGLGIHEQVMILPGRDDVPRFFAAADILLHPAYQESAGYVLLEAAIAGLPVLTTASCGYASYIEQEKLGHVCPEPFRQTELDSALEDMLQQLPHAPWSANGLAFGKQDRLYRMPQQVADIIEGWVAQQPAGGSQS